MGAFKLGGMTLKSLFSKPETIMYPVEKPPAPEGLKGHIVNDLEKCNFCGSCMRVCPTDAIVVNKQDQSWSIDPFRCIQCGHCWRNCPKECLSMDPEYSAPSASKAIYTYTVDGVSEKTYTEA